MGDGWALRLARPADSGVSWVFLWDARDSWEWRGLGLRPVTLPPYLAAYTAPIAPICPSLCCALPCPAALLQGRQCRSSTPTSLCRCPLGLSAWASSSSRWVAGGLWGACQGLGRAGQARAQAGQGMPGPRQGRAGQGPSRAEQARAPAGQGRQRRL
jgi:hypothetical protein